MIGFNFDFMYSMCFHFLILIRNLLSNGLVFQVSSEIALIKFAWYMFIHSTNKTFKNKVKHINNIGNDDIIEEIYMIIEDKCNSAAYPFLYLKNNETKFEIDSFKKKCLLEGLDDIALSLEKTDKIILFEKNLKNSKPWIFND